MDVISYVDKQLADKQRQRDISLLILRVKRISKMCNGVTRSCRNRKRAKKDEALSLISQINPALSEEGCEEVLDAGLRPHRKEYRERYGELYRCPRCKV